MPDEDKLEGGLVMIDEELTEAMATDLYNVFHKYKPPREQALAAMAKTLAFLMIEKFGPNFAAFRLNMHGFGMLTIAIFTEMMLKRAEQAEQEGAGKRRH